MKSSFDFRIYGDRSKHNLTTFNLERANDVRPPASFLNDEVKLFTNDFHDEDQLPVLKGIFWSNIHELGDFSYRIEVPNGDDSINLMLRVGQEGILNEVDIGLRLNKLRPKTPILQGVLGGFRASIPIGILSLSNEPSILFNHSLLEYPGDLYFDNLIYDLNKFLALQVLFEGLRSLFKSLGFTHGALYISSITLIDLGKYMDIPIERNVRFPSLYLPIIGDYRQANFDLDENRHTKDLQNLLKAYDETLDVKDPLQTFKLLQESYQVPTGNFPILEPSTQYENIPVSPRPLFPLRTNTTKFDDSASSDLEAIKTLSSKGFTDKPPPVDFETSRHFIMPGYEQFASKSISYDEWRDQMEDYATEGERVAEWLRNI